MYIKSDLTC